MKKVFSLLIVLAMLASTCAIFSIPAAAVDGIWDTHGPAYQLDDDYEGDKKSVAGYNYDSEGLHIHSADWSTTTPWSHVSTKDKVDLKQGVYMKVRIDSFEYDADDRWFNFNIRNMPTIQPGSPDKSYGIGVQSLIKINYDEANTLSIVNWYTGAFDSAGQSAVIDNKEGGKNILILQVSWDGSSYSLTVNGISASQPVIDYMNSNYSEDSYAHVGFTMQSSDKGGEQSATILKFGHTEEDATVPSGDDEKESENYYGDAPHPIADPSTVPEGEPAILMTGDKEYSDIGNAPSSSIGSEISITEDMLVHVVASGDVTDCGTWSVKNEVSYDIKDFPVFMVMTKNYCTCGVENCQGVEEISCYLPTGEKVSPGEAVQITGIAAHTNACNIEDDGYLFFIHDVSSELKTEANPDGRFEGRINSSRVDMHIDTKTVGANEFDVVMQCFFRTVEDAEAYAMDYLITEGYDPDAQPPQDDTTEAPAGDDTTEAPAGDDTTEAPAGNDTTEAPAGNDTTEAPAGDDTTEAPAGNDATEAPTTGDDSSSGCFGTVGFGAIAIVAVVAAAGYVSFKKKD